MTKKTAAIGLSIFATMLAIVAGTQYQQLAPAASTQELEGTVKVLGAKIESAKSQEANDETKLKEAIDFELDQKTYTPRRAEELKANLKSKVGETSSMPALEEAAQKTKAVETQVEELKKTPQASVAPSYFDYNPKLLFSFLFCLAGLFIILRGTYSESTEKFAFSLISTVIGVWLGTLTS